MALFRRRSGSAAASRESLAALAAQHVLLLPRSVPNDVVSDLVAARVPGTDLAATGRVRLGRHSSLSGPHELTMEQAVAAQVPTPWTLAYALTAPVERDPLPAGVTLPGDRDGLTRVFRHGLPYREEGAGLDLLLALARRLDGAVRLAGRPGADDLLHPDPAHAVDLVVHAPYWIDPETLLPVVARELPGAYLATEGEEWHGEANAADRQALAVEDVLDAYAVVAPLGGLVGSTAAGIGQLSVLVHVAEQRPAAVSGESWASEVPVITYEVRWEPDDAEQRDRELPSAAHVRGRELARPWVHRVTRAVVEVAQGVVVDEGGFLVDRYAL